MPAHLQVPPADWSNLDLDLSGTDLASLAGGPPGYHLGGSGSGGFSPAYNIVPMGSPVPQNATQVYSALQLPPVSLNAGAQPPAPSLEDAARSAPFNMTDRDLAGIRAQTEWPIQLQEGAIKAGESLAQWLAPPPAKPIVIGAKAVLNHELDEIEPQRKKEAYENGIYRAMNNQMIGAASADSAPRSIQRLWGW